MKPSIKVAVLIAVALVAMGLGLVAVGWPGNEAALLPAVFATALCLLSTTATLLLAEAVRRLAPNYLPVGILMGTGVRIAVAVVGVLLFGEVLERFGAPRESFAHWVTYLYLVTLIAECGLLIRGESGTPP